ncbi:2-dehydropantoate 2-reductase [Siccirubricoccus sp. KC 17139]|uniref:2-dehydropantoate 2-reductase n=1 Tax=Siccirubricoccus soli TaxID=2899147 RepID=A0ABT1DD37_9PROT|nr:2-dehydropantoate 2-reductase [Siccirubricoccus soli]MCO6418860.1 2-dehydropantoate 2-reductase [Siccirubricoccus soli]MCP2684995.1 2-dehydropantoate 2-reductase [Siccirubricoccus soli]
MRITLLGAGAVGGWLAAGLARAGADLAILARGASLAALQRDGLVFRHGTTEERFRLPASDDPAALAGADILLLGLKSQDLPAALPLIRRLLGPSTLIATAQNGLPWWFLQGFGGPAEGLTLQSIDPGGALAAALPAARVLGGVAHVGSRVEAPGTIRLMQQDRMLFGDPSGRNPEALAALLALLRQGGIPAEPAGDIRREIWLKLWGNSNMNPLSALCRADMQAMLEDPGVAGLVRAMMREMAALGDRIGLPITQSIEDRLVVTRRLGPFRTSMLQDLEAGRRLELGPVLGCLVELAGHLGEEVPVLAGVHGLVRLLTR